MVGLRRHAAVLAITICLSTIALSQAAKDKKAGAQSDNSSPSTPSSGSALWITPTSGECGFKGKKLVFALLKSDKTASQPYYVVPQVPDSGLPVFYSGDALNIEIVAAKGMITEIPLINIGIDLQKADPINAAPVRPTFQQSSVSAAVVVANSFCVTWPQKLTPDAVPKITIAAIYTPGGSAKAEDQKTISLATVSFPQIHNLYRYNLAFGIIGSTLHNPSFSRVQTSLASSGNSAQFKTVKDNGDPYVAPALFLTAYIFKLDAESPWRPKDLRPQPSIGFSLTAPSDNFFFGASSEILRNVQIVYGYHLGRVTELAPTFVDDPTSSAAPATRKAFGGGGFLGMTFNIDFIKGLFSSK